MRALGEAQRSYPAIQVTGTNGKTSSARMAAALLEAEGLKTGLYTSPHLTRFTERITVAGNEIPEEVFYRELGRIIAVAEALGLGDLTGFELLTALAFRWFAVMEVQAAVLEVGMGGRWDATSLVVPRTSIITNVEMDHKDYLGETLEEIAREKAFVIKEGTVAVTAERRPGIMAIFEERAANIGGKLKVLGEDFSAESLPEETRSVANCRRVKVKGLYGEYLLPLPAEGEHQRSNLALAAAAAEAFLDRPLSEVRSAGALARLSFPGRLELLPGDPPILLDGAHNPAAARALARYLSRRDGGTAGGLILVLAVLADKDIPGILAPLLTLARAAVYSANDSRRCALPEHLASLAPTHPPEERVVPDLAEAIEVARAIARPGDLICITGSLYTVGLARRLLQYEAGRPKR